MLHGDRLLAFESPFCVEVDTADDLEYLGYEIREKNPSIYGLLKGE